MKKNISRIVTSFVVFFFIALPSMAQRYVDKIDRGLVAVPSASNGNLVSWRILGEEYYDVTYNVYRNGECIGTNWPRSDYNDTSGAADSEYQVAAVVRGVEQEKCEPVKRWEKIDDNAALVIPVEEIIGRDGTNVNSHYAMNDIYLGDLTGDGVVEFIVKRPCDIVDDPSQSNCFNVFDAYDRFGNRLWWIDLGPNIVGNVQVNCICYDWDMDGKAEVVLRGADNMIIHHADDSTTEIGDMTADYRFEGMENILEGPEYLLYLEGATGKPYQIGPAEHPDYIDFPLPRGNVSDWGDNYGHRSTNFFYGAPYLDGRKPSLFLSRGIYTKHLMKAFDIDPDTHQLNLRWEWECTDSSSDWYAQGFHNFAIADVDWDGKDEIVFGSMVIDDDGMGLCTTGLGHGDAQHCSNFDPYRHGQQQYTCNEASPNNCFYDATTGEILYRNVGTSDDGRALMGNFSNDYPGSIGRTVNTGFLSATSHKIIDALGTDDYINYGALNQRIYWDNDLCDEVFNSPGTEGYGAIYKPGGSRYNFSSSKCSNGSKNNPGAIADIFGDWREELVMRKSDNTAILVYATPIYTRYALPTLWHDHQYRNSIAWQSMGYNQPPHKSYFLGEMEDITVAPPPLIMTGRTEISNGGTITNSDEHFIVCEWNDTQINITDGASPYIVTFYVPSDVSGNAQSNAKSNVEPTYAYYTCNVTGGALTGSTRVIKQGDGILCLPKVDMTYTGETNIWAGTLNFDGTLKNSPLWLNRFAELNSDGGTFRSIKADYAAIIRPGGADNKGTITTDTLALGFGSHIQLDLYSEGLSADQINASILTIETKTGSAWETYGPEYLVPVIDIIAHTANGEKTLADGDYILGTIGTISGSLSDIKVEGISGQAKSLKLDDKGQLVLSISSVREPTTIYWNGTISDVWNYAGEKNFLDGNGQEDIFVSGDDVIFNDNAAEYTVSLTDELDPSAVTISSSKDYTFGGSGRLVGEFSLTKEGSGTLTIGNENTYIGTTTIGGGTVKVSSLSNSTHSSGNLGAVSTTPIVVKNGATLQNTSAVTMDTPIETQTDNGGILYNGADFDMNGRISGTKLEKKGSGKLNLYGNNSTLERLVISEGTVEAMSSGTPAVTVEFQGGTLYDDDISNVSHGVYVPSGQTGTWYVTKTNYGYYANKLTGEGTLTIIPRNTSNRVCFTGDWTEFYGTVKHTTTSTTFPFDMSTNLSHATLDIASGCSVSNTGKTINIGAVTGSGTLMQYYSTFHNGNTASGTNTWQIGNNDGNDFTFAGTITDEGSSNKCVFTKVGTCKMTYTGTSDFQGAATVEAGELCLNNSGSNAMLGTGALSISNNGTLSGKGTLKNSSTTVNAGGRLCCGFIDDIDPAWGVGEPGVLSFNGSNITVNGILEVHINNSTTTVLTNVGTLTLSGTLRVKGEISGLSIGDQVKIIDANSISVGSGLIVEPYCLPNGGAYMWDTSRLDEGLLVVMAIPDGITNINAPELDNATIYTLQGVKLDVRPTKPGIYIVNGVKTLLK